ncbi:hypothetical protein ACN23B_10280 [Anabaena sp. FACHB-709]|uniref:Lipoprotein n=2 Tax=Nostocaceae TaxID=1162 RepID=A0A1Z4KFC5_ANAVA|nr:MULTISPECIES: hypothetical protein [Nostocaceae]BAY67674.1 hypothetical protein NIES23_04520 [Trichormus variabilis NIES-23]HBW33007.1 hypothetical protein [Nostoc sp. UBA8866]MBD2173897.1 hypothetical protein [Anabaena cylindrica FACHB-318]MBD2265646.1 hypothetical protein [Anabaena sp. FACHB-709]MBD2275003.1 hypothetical protein [Nostoc sp. PCC 7120 = FACHB-418]
MKKNNFLKNVVAPIFVASLSLSCNTNISQRTESAQAVGQQQTQPQIIYGDLVIKEPTDYLMIPVNSTGRDIEKEASFDYSRSSKGYNVLLHNFIFYRKEDGASHLLLNKKSIIQAFDLVEIKTTGQPSTRVWLYQIIDQDTNKDNKFNQEDAVIGYMSDLSGKNLQQVTPNNSKIINWAVVPGRKEIFIKIIKDSNKDNKFSAADQINFVKVNLAQPSMGQEIISGQIEQEIKSLMK